MKTYIRLYIILLCSLQIANATENGQNGSGEKLYVSNSFTVYGLENLHVASPSAEILTPKVSQIPKTNPLKACAKRSGKATLTSEDSATPILHAFPIHPYQDISLQQLVSCAVLPTNPTIKILLFSNPFSHNVLRIEDSKNPLASLHSLSPDYLLLPQDYASNFGTHSPPAI